MINNKLLRNLDCTLIGVTVLLNIISIIMIGSATHVNSIAEDRYWYMQRQGIFFLVNVLIVFFTLKFDYRNLLQASKVIYFFNLLMLVAVLVVGHSALGAQRWIQIGPVSLQPSEFSKIIMIVTFAAFLEERKGKLKKLVDIAPVLLFVIIPAIIVMKQPDLGTSLVFFAIMLGMVYVAGINTRFLLSSMGICVLLLPVFWQVLKEYQKSRIKVFLNPEMDPLGSGYHVIQSKIAIGSGLITGKGLFQGTQSQLSFLPENHTDFIFAVIGEELGLIGCLFVLLLYAILIYRGLKIAMNAQDDFGALIAVGIVSMFIFHLFVNIGMTIGIMPVTGVPLPFMSYGVSALTTNMLSVGLLLNINMRKQKLMF